MRNTDERTMLILQRVRVLRHKREKSSSAALAVLCCICWIFLVFLFRVLADGGGTMFVPKMCGSSLLYCNAGGYVLTGVLAFMTGVITTVFCIRRQKKSR